jgi:saccharopine dehydrogenase (NAD+, L-lysine-forming)
MSRDVVVLGATGATGRLIVGELAARGVSLVLAGRDRDRLAELAPAGARVETVDLHDPESLRAASGAGRVLVNTVGPFATLAPAVVAACLSTGTGYVDIGNEQPAMHALLDRDAEARGRGVTLVTGAGFGLVATESLILRLVADSAAPVTRALVAMAPDSAFDTEGVRASVAATLSEGATWYADGALVRAPLGTGATTLTFAGMDWNALPVPLGDLAAARRITGAADVIAYRAAPATGADLNRTSYAYAEITDTGGRQAAAELRTGEGFAVTAAVAAETVTRLLRGTAAPGAWTPGQLLGGDLLDHIPGTTITVTAGSRP